MHFGVNVLDLDAHELRRADEAIEVEPRTYAVLAHLVRHRDRVVPKEELLDEIWGDRFVSESALTSQIKHARVAVGDDGRSQQVIKTVHRVGYRFVADVVEEVAPEHGRGEPRSLILPRWDGRPSPLVGRAGDLTAVGRCLADHSLVTITGPGGVGKTALAGALLEQLSSSVPDGAWMCSLADTRDPGALGAVVLDALGQGQQSDADPVESVARALEGRRSVLVLDNCEHLHDDAAQFTRELLVRCPDLRILATSRMPLGVDGETIHPLQPLELDDAVRCFVERANDAGGAADATDPAVVELCRRLDCIPLAIELAAARARLLSPGEMLTLLPDRFRLLRDDQRDDQRHTSLHRTIEWSWIGLEAEDQQLLAALSVFVGPFTLDDVRTVALPGSDPLDAVDSTGRLVSHSLVVPTPADSGDTRFRMLESVRDFAAEQLVQPARTRLAHAEHFTRHAEALDGDFQTERIDHAVAAMRAAWPNLRAAIGYALDGGEPAFAHRIIRAVGAYADVFQLYEVLDWCARADLDHAVDDSTDDSTITADALAIEARMLAHRGDHEAARARAERAHELCETHATLLSIVWCAYYRGDLDLVVSSATRLQELSRSDRGFDRGFADGFAAIVSAVRQEGDVTSTPVTPDRAAHGLLGVQDCLVEGFRIFAADPERAAELLEAVVTHSLERDYRLHLGAAASSLTQITLPARPAPEAMATLRRTLQRYLDRSMWVLISADTVMAAKLLADHGDVETAARLLGARAASGYAVGLSEVLHSMLRVELESRLGDRFEELAAQGAAWRPPEAGRAAIAALDAALGDLG
ncbi:MAG: winged helix-turn-helix domain-containing protein [Acidimicrobiales bacterium]|nr:winged helix-turn-helix domain-containing protein [Acidimicrobiales bacterium]